MLALIIFDLYALIRITAAALATLTATIDSAGISACFICSGGNKRLLCRPSPPAPWHAVLLSLVLRVLDLAPELRRPVPPLRRMLLLREFLPSETSVVLIVDISRVETRWDVVY